MTDDSWNSKAMGVTLASMLAGAIGLAYLTKQAENKDRAAGVEAQNPPLELTLLHHEYDIQTFPMPKGEETYLSADGTWTSETYVLIGQDQKGHTFSIDVMDGYGSVTRKALYAHIRELETHGRVGLAITRSSEFEGRSLPETNLSWRTLSDLEKNVKRMEKFAFHISARNL